MVRRQVFLGAVWLLLVATSLFADPLLEIEVHGERSAANQPIECLVKVKRSEGSQVDPLSFQLQGKLLEVEFLHDSIHSSLTIINGTRREERHVSSVYRFRLPGVAAGEYVLPPVSVVIDGKRFQSEAIAYFVYGSKESDHLRLSSFVRGGNKLYPGQRATFGYRLSFKKLIEPVVQSFPMLEAQGFRKLGEPVVNYDAQGEVTVQEVVQEVQALSPGTYTFDTPFVEGLAYKRDFFGRRLYEKQRLRTEGESVVVEVLPFPEQGRPESFNGALGNFELSARLLTPAEVMVGDRLRVEVAIRGDGIWSTVKTPEFLANRQLRSQFRLSDLPPTVVTDEGEKRFVMELRPLAADVHEIPPLQFSSFDPIREQYVTSRTAPIAITVKLPSSLTGALESPPVALKNAIESHGDECAAISAPPLLEIGGILSLRSEELLKGGPHWSLLWVYPIGAFACLLQWLLRLWLVHRKPAGKTFRPRDLMRQAKAEWTSDRASALRDVEAAFLLALYEKGYTPDLVGQATSLPFDGFCGRVRACVEALHAQRYGAAAMESESQLLESTQVLWEELCR